MSVSLSSSSSACSFVYTLRRFSTCWIITSTALPIRLSWRSHVGQVTRAAARLRVGCAFPDLVNGSEHLGATGNSGHGLDEDVQVLLEPLDDFHGLVVILAERNQSLKREKTINTAQGGNLSLKTGIPGPGGREAGLPAVGPGSWTPPCGRSPPPGRATAPPASVSSPV